MTETRILYKCSELLNASHFTMTTTQQKDKLDSSKNFSREYIKVFFFNEIRVASKSIKIQKFIVQDI